MQSCLKPHATPLVLWLVAVPQVNHAIFSRAFALMLNLDLSALGAYRLPAYQSLGFRPRARYHVTLQRKSPAGETPFDWGAEGASRPESLRQKDRSGTLTLESGRLAIHRRG